MAVKENTTIQEALKISPAAVGFFKKHEAGCLRCKGANRETIAQWARSHGLSPESIVEEINSLDKGIRPRP